MLALTYPPATGLCPRCGQTLTSSDHRQPALFLHGGYGETTRFEVETCWCGVRVTERTAESPRRLVETGP